MIAQNWIYLPTIIHHFFNDSCHHYNTFGIIFYFKAIISEKTRNEQNYGLSIELTQQRAYEDRYLMNQMIRKLISMKPLLRPHQ